jgi:hypothetical protein
MAIRGPPRGLQQQGSLDWIRLAEISVDLTVDTMSRLSQAGVDALTLFAAQLVFSEFNLSEFGERRVQGAVDYLQCFPSYSSILWFGFGVRSIVRKLAESTAGLACIGIIACLSEGYSTVDAARISRALFADVTENRAPGHLTPPLNQWTRLVEACEGVLSTTNFGVTVHEIIRLNGQSNPLEIRCKSEPSAIAKALKAVAKVSNGSLEQVRIIGGMDCAWIAAVAHWLLDISVEARNASGDIIYRPGSVQKPSTTGPQVLIQFVDPSSVGLELVSQCYVVPDGAPLFTFTFSDVGGAFSNGRVPWISILHASFGRSVDVFLQRGAVTHFGTALGCAARVFNALLCDDNDLPDGAFYKYRQDWSFISPSSHGVGFASTVRKRLSEISQSEMVMDALERSVTKSFQEAVSDYEQAIGSIRTICGCVVCEGRAGSEGIASKKRVYCATLLVQVITRLVLLVASIDMPRNILPVVSGIELLYSDCLGHWESCKATNELPHHLLCGVNNDILSQACSLFTGRRISNSKHMSAFTSDGICFYRDVLTQVSVDPERCNLVHVVPGKIEWDSIPYEAVTDRTGDQISYNSGSDVYKARSGRSISPIDLEELPDTCSSDLTCELMVEEPASRNSKTLTATYRMASKEGRFLVKPVTISRRLACALSAASCKGRNCLDGPIELAAYLVEGEGLMAGLGDPPGIPILRVLPKNEIAQWIALSQDWSTTNKDGTISSPLDRAQPAERSRFVLESHMQGSQCLYCLLLNVVRGPRSEIMKSRRDGSGRKVCIVTSSSNRTSIS